MGSSIINDFIALGSQVDFVGVYPVRNIDGAVHNSKNIIARHFFVTTTLFTISVINMYRGRCNGNGSTSLEGTFARNFKKRSIQIVTRRRGQTRDDAVRWQVLCIAVSETVIFGSDTEGRNRGGKRSDAQVARSSRHLELIRHDLIRGHAADHNGRETRNDGSIVTRVNGRHAGGDPLHAILESVAHKQHGVETTHRSSFGAAIVNHRIAETFEGNRIGRTTVIDGQVSRINRNLIGTCHLRRWAVVVV